MTTSIGIASVLIADDHPLVLRALKDLIDREADFDVIAAVTDGRIALASMREHPTDLAVLDLTMPGNSGLSLLKTIAAEALPVRVILLTASISDEQILDAITAGVFGVLLKESAPETLMACMRQVVAGQKWLPAELVEPAVARQKDRSRQCLPSKLLTGREAEIVRLVSEGLSNRDIAREIGVTEGTVKIHLHNIYGKLRVDNRTRLAAMVFGWGDR